MSAPVIVPVIMSGGAGTRLWPLSRRAKPKQMHALFGEKSLLQETLNRVPSDAGFAAPIVICAEAHVTDIHQQLRAIGVTAAHIIAEPVPRNTAPCAAVAAHAVAAQFGPDALVLLLAADHFVADPIAFRATIITGAKSAKGGHIVTFGPKPTRPETGYGYLLAGADIGNGAFKLDKFVEKPNMATAKSWLADGRYLWNAGIFLFRADVMLAQIHELRPAIAHAAKLAWQQTLHEADHILLERSAFAACPAQSVDTAVMESTQLGAVIPLDVGWSDVGSWPSIYELSAKDTHENACAGPVITIDSHNCLVRSDGLRIAVVGMDEVAVIATDAAVLVMPFSQAQKVREVVEQLDESER